MVNFLNAVVPGTVVRIPSLLTRAQADVAAKHISDVQALLGNSKAPLAAAIQECVEIKTPYKIRPMFDECITAYRSELYKDIKDPFHRLTLHEAIMAAGFYYHSLATQAGVPTENRRFVVNHYNFDARRDRILTEGVHKAVISKEHTPEEDRLLTDLLQLERRLFGDYRMVPVSGTQFLCLGLPCSEITNEEELKRILDYPIMRDHGGFGTREEEGCHQTKKKATKIADRWKKTTVFSKIEADHEMMSLPSTYERVTPEEKTFTVTTLLPAPPLTWRERLREAMLRAFVTGFAIWLSIWFIDEELATLIVLLVLKYKQTKNMREEAEKTESKLYLAQAGGNRMSNAPTPKY